MARPQAAVGGPKESSADADHRARLVALRDRLEGAIVEAGHRDLAPLSARYQSVLDQLAAMPEAPEVADVVDDLTARRSRSAAAKRSQRPAAG